MDWLWAPEERGVTSEFMIFNLSDLRWGCQNLRRGGGETVGVRLVRSLWVRMCCVEMPMRCPSGGACR